MQNIIKEYDSFYFIGIGGVSMSALAKMLVDFGKIVGGSDLRESEYTYDLIKRGISVAIGNYDDSVENYQVVVYTDAVGRNNQLLVKAHLLNKVIISRGQLLDYVSQMFFKTIAVCGCHGKTTCTAMLAHIYKCSNKQFACHIGGRDVELDNYYNCGKDYFITEACEYKKNFTLLKPNFAVILNSDADHLECYSSYKELKNCYETFAEKCSCAVYLYNDLSVNGGVTFGLDRGADFYAKDIVCVGGKYQFLVCAYGDELGKIKLNVYGKHNILNALSAVAVASIDNVDFSDIKNGLESFYGVRRRFENIGNINGAVCIVDYAHHPNEIEAVVSTALQMCDGEVYVVFQPHTYSRTKNLFMQFVKVLLPISNLLIYKTFPAREYYDDEGSALTLSKAIKNSIYADDLSEIKDFLSNVKNNDIVLFLGAGDIYYIAKKLVAVKNY
jgi:UDP-N-acetylmuramate--alanine ligase